MQLFYTTNFLKSGLITLEAEEARHCLKVLRKKPGDLIEVVDGKGNLYKGVLEDDSTKKCTIRINETISNFEKRSFEITIAIAPPKNMARFEWFLEKATEVGVDVIYPVITKHSERRKLNSTRLNKILINAMKQSGKAFLPDLKDLISFKTFLKHTDLPDERYIGTCDWKEPVHLKELYRSGKDAVILIGPEGDFTKEEVESAIEKGFKPISLGKSRLRVETAGLIACHTINLMND